MSRAVSRYTRGSAYSPCANRLQRKLYTVFLVYSASEMSIILRKTGEEHLHIPILNSSYNTHPF